MAQPARSRVQVLTYLVIVLAFSSVFYFLILHSGSLGNGRGLYVLGLMWCPALAGMLTLRLNGRSISDLGWKWGETKYQVRSWYIPILYASIAYAIVWIFRFGAFGNPEYYDAMTKTFHQGGPPWVSILLGIVLTGTYGLIRSVSSALGEEIGWRGFLVPQLAKVTSFGRVSLVSGVVWSLWHYPIMLMGLYKDENPLWYSMTCFTVMVLGMSFLFAWMRLKSGSVWTGMLLHASHNLFIQGIFDPLTRPARFTNYAAGEFGFGLALVSIALAIIFYGKRGELPPAA